MGQRRYLGTDPKEGVEVVAMFEYRISYYFHLDDSPHPHQASMDPS